MFLILVHILIHWFIGTLVGWLPSIGLNKAPDKPQIFYRSNTNDIEKTMIALNDQVNECNSNDTYM